MSWRSLEIPAWASAYLGFLVFAVCAHNFSPSYRAVYIDCVQADWLADASMAYEPGSRIEGAKPAAFFATGWWWPGDGGRWGKGGESTLALQPTADLPAGTRLTGKIGVFFGKAAAVTIDILVNGREAGRVQFSAPARPAAVNVALGPPNLTSFDFLLPAALARGQAAKIEFRDSDPSSNYFAFGGPSIDSLGVWLSELTLVPVVALSAVPASG